MHLSAASRSVKKEKSHGLGTFWMVTMMAPKGYTPGLRLASTTEASGMANLDGGGLAPVAAVLGVNAATSLRKHRWFEKTKSSPELSGVSPLQHSYTPSNFSSASWSLKCARHALVTIARSFAVPF